MKFMYFSIKYRYSDILLKNIYFIHKRLLCCNHTCYYAGMVSVTSVSRYVTSALRYQSSSSMYIRGLIPRNWPRQLRLTNPQHREEPATSSLSLSSSALCLLIEKRHQEPHHKAYHSTCIVSETLNCNQHTQVTM